MVSPTSAVADLLASKAVARTPGLGGYVWETWTADKSLLEELPRGIEGLVVNTIFEGRPLARAGIAKFDVIVSCDGKPTRRRHDFLNQIRSKPTGSTFELEIVKPGSQARKTVYLTSDCLEDLWK
jgi:S1-C subfamily serine protease